MLCKADHRRPKYIRKCFHGSFEGFAANLIKFANAMEQLRMFLRWLIAPALLGKYMQKHRTITVYRILQKMDQVLRIVTIHRTQVGKTHILKNICRNQRSA